ncbi:mucin-1 isoform X2 [Lissotriton helveticus]
MAPRRPPVAHLALLVLLSLGCVCEQDNPITTQVSTINVTSKPNTVTEQSTAATTSPGAAPLVLYNLTLHITNVEYTTELSNSSSPEFKNMSEQITQLCDQLYNCSGCPTASTYLGVEVIEFSNGSIIAHTALNFASSGDITLADVKSAVANATNSTVNGLTISEATVTPITQVTTTATPVTSGTVMLSSQVSHMSTSGSVTKTEDSVSTTSPSSETTTHPTGTPATVTGQSTAATTSSGAAPLVLFNLTLHITNVEYTTELSNSSSPEFKNMKEQITRLCDQLYNCSGCPTASTYLGVEVVGFSNGSIIAHTALNFASSGDITLADVKSAVANATNSTVNGLTISEATVTPITQVTTTATPVTSGTVMLSSQVSHMSTSGSVTKTEDSVSTTSPSSETTTHPTGTPATVTGQSTAATTSSGAAPLVLFNLTLHITNVEYTTELSNSSSPEFKNMSEQITQLCDQLYNCSGCPTASTYLGVEVVGFSNGSIIAHTALNFASSGDITLADVKSAVANATNSTVGGLTISEATVTPITQVTTTATPVTSGTVMLSSQVSHMSTSGSVTKTEDSVSTTSPSSETTTHPTGTPTSPSSETTTHPTGTPATVTGQSTAATTSSGAAPLVLYNLTLHITNVEYTTELSNSSSPEFKNMSEQITRLCDQLYNCSGCPTASTYLGVEVVGFSNGSIIAHTALNFASSGDITLADVKSAVANATNSTVNGLTISEATVTPITQVTTTATPVTSGTVMLSSQVSHMSTSGSVTKTEDSVSTNSPSSETTGTPSTVTGQSTAATTSPGAAPLVLYNLTLHITNVEYTTELSNSSSPEFKNMSEQITKLCDKLYNCSGCPTASTYLGVEVVGFSNGSIIAHTALNFASSGDITLADVKSAVANATNSTVNGLTISEATVTPITQVTTTATPVTSGTVMLSSQVSHMSTSGSVTKTEDSVSTNSPSSETIAHPTGTPATVTGQSTAATTSPGAAPLVLYNLTLHITNVEYTTELSNSSSPEFKNMSEQITQLCDELYNCSGCPTASTFLGVEVVGFSNGSIIARTALNFASSGDITLADVKSAVANATNSTVNGLTISEVTVTPITQVTTTATPVTSGTVMLSSQVSHMSTSGSVTKTEDSLSTNSPSSETTTHHTGTPTSPSSETTAHPTRTPATVTGQSTAVTTSPGAAPLVLYNLTLHITNVEYTTELSNSSSPEFKNMSEQITKLCDELYNCSGCPTASTYLGVEVVGFSNGSIIAHTALNFASSGDITLADVEKALANATNSTVNGLTISEATVTPMTPQRTTTAAPVTSSTVTLSSQVSIITTSGSVPKTEDSVPTISASSSGTTAHPTGTSTTAHSPSPFTNHESSPTSAVSVATGGPASTGTLGTRSTTETSSPGTAPTGTSSQATVTALTPSSHSTISTASSSSTTPSTGTSTAKGTPSDTTNKTPSTAKPTDASISSTKPASSSSQVSQSSTATPTTSITQSPAKVIYLSFRMTDPLFSNELNDPNSQAHKDMVAKVKNVCNEVYGCSGCSTQSTYDGVTVLDFRSGSVIADNRLNFKGNGITPNQAENLFNEQLKSGSGSISGTPINGVTASRNEIASPTTWSPVPGWGIALLVLVCFLVLLAIIGIIVLLLKLCRRSQRGEMEIFASRGSYHPMNEYPSYQTHARYEVPGKKGSYELQANGSNSQYSFTNPGVDTNNL